MKIIDSKNRTELRNLILLLTISEASELRDELERLLSIESKSKDDHGHVTDEDFEKEISLALYSVENFENFDTWIQNIIKSQ